MLTRAVQYLIPGATPTPGPRAQPAARGMYLAASDTTPSKTATPM
jgi:hypothetical protein